MAAAAHNERSSRRLHRPTSVEPRQRVARFRIRQIEYEASSIENVLTLIDEAITIVVLYQIGSRTTMGLTRRLNGSGAQLFVSPHGFTRLMQEVRIPSRVAEGFGIGQSESAISEQLGTCS